MPTAEVWRMRKERDAGRTRFLGVSNVSLHHLEYMIAAHAKVRRSYRIAACPPGLDREVRRFCRERKIVYQGFSLLTRMWKCYVIR